MGRFLFIWIITFLVIAVLGFIGVQIDLVFNSFLRNIEPNWWSVFTTGHGVTIAFLYFPYVYWGMLATASTLTTAYLSK